MQILYSILHISHGFWISSMSSTNTSSALYHSSCINIQVAKNKKNLAPTFLLLMPEKPICNMNLCEGANSKISTLTITLTLNDTN